MKTAPENLRQETIIAALSQHWDIDVSKLIYAPVGYGSHHWIAETQSGEKWFISVDDLTSAYLGETEHEGFRVLERAFEATAALHDTANLKFVNAPLADSTGRRILRLSHQYSIAVFPFLDVTPTEFDLFPTQDDLRDAIQAMVDIHNATPHITANALPSETFQLPKRTELVKALGELDSPWHGGPYSEPTRILLGENRDTLLNRLEEFDQLALEEMADRSGWVVTHGEPHAGNVIRTGAGTMAVVDWAAVALAPPERDLWMLLDESNAESNLQPETRQFPSSSERALNVYRLKWNLSDIAVFVSIFRNSHDQSIEMEMIWSELNTYVHEVVMRLCRASQ